MDSANKNEDVRDAIEVATDTTTDPAIEQEKPVEVSIWHRYSRDTVNFRDLINT